MKDYYMIHKSINLNIDNYDIVETLDVNKKYSR